MRKLFRIFFVGWLMSASLCACSPSEHDCASWYGDLEPLPRVAQESDPTTTDPEPNTEPHKRHGHRMPSRPVKISIIRGQGVSISGIDKDDVISYSIYNEAGMLIAKYDNDLDFASAVFAMTGLIEIRIDLDGYSLCGWMVL